MAIPALLECVFSAAYVCFCCCTRCDCGLVYYCFLQAMAFQRAFSWFLAVTCLAVECISAVVFVLNFCVVALDDSSDVGCVAVADF